SRHSRRSLVFSCTSKLFVAQKKLKCFIFSGIQTLFAKHRGWEVPSNVAAALLGVRERVACNSLEDRYRGLLRLDHGSMRKDEGLFQRVLPFQHGVAYEIREYHPGGIWREFPALFWTVSLKLRIFFHRIVATMHKTVIRRTPRPCKAKRRQNPAHPFRQGLFTAGSRQAQTLRETRRERLKCLR